MLDFAFCWVWVLCLLVWVILWFGTLVLDAGVVFWTCFVGINVYHLVLFVVVGLC